MHSVKIDRYLRVGILALVGVFVYLVYAAIYQRVVVAGDKAPDFSVTTEDGRTVSLSNFGGKVLILNFWASWCAPCRQETPSMSQFAADYASKGVVVLGISVDKDAAAYRTFLQKYDPKFLVAHDVKIHQEYGTFMYPETYIIDSTGKVRLKIPDAPDKAGDVNWSDPQVRHYIDSLL